MNLHTAELTILCGLTQCSWVGRYQRLDGTCCLLLNSRWVKMESVGSSKMQVSLHQIAWYHISGDRNFSYTVVKISNLIHISVGITNKAKFPYSTLFALKSLYVYETEMSRWDENYKSPNFRLIQRKICLALTRCMNIKCVVSHNQEEIFFRGLFCPYW
jgi:hypothetical protein